MLMGGKLKHSLVLSQGNLGNMEAQLEHLPDKPCRCLVQGTGMSKDQKDHNRINEITTTL
jgi:hypothetical protein